jgi:hypothetical protein
MTETERNLSTADIAQQRTDEPTLAESEQPGPDPQPRSGATAAAPDGAPAKLEPLLGQDDAEGFRSRWESIQTGFVDSPRQAVEEADGLVAELMQRLAQTFTEERESLEAQWSRGDDVSTEDLRVGLQRYRSFFERLLTT